MWRTITVAGSGICGASFACALAEMRIFEQISVFDMREMPSYPGRLIYKTPAVLLTKQSVDFFKSIGIWQKIDPKDFAPIKTMQILDFYSPITSIGNFSGAAIRKETLYFHLNQHLANYPNVILHTNSIVEYLEPTQFGMKVEVGNMFYSEKEKVESGFVVGADGMDSKVRQIMSIGRLSTKVPQKIVKCSVRGSEPLKHLTIKTVVGGRITLFPLNENDATVCWQAPSKQAEMYHDLTSRDFLDELNKELRKPPMADPSANRDNMFPIFEKVFTKRQIVEGTNTLTTKYTKRKVMLLGSAGHSANNFPQEGINSQIAMTIKMAHAVCLEAKSNKEYGSTLLMPSLQSYKKSRQSNIFELSLFLLSANSYISNKIRSLIGMLTDRFWTEDSRGEFFQKYFNGFQRVDSNWPWSAK